MQRAHVFVSGIVQGVCFRHYTTQEANDLGIKGWVRNLNDGRVEILMEGEKQTLEKLIQWCHQGPSTAKVSSVEIHWENYIGDLGLFKATY